MFITVSKQVISVQNFKKFWFNRGGGMDGAWEA